MANYGIPYQGSRGTLAHKLAAILPGAENFYDLFGGGFSVSHYMYLHKKYKHVHYNEIESDTVELVKAGIAGKYNYKTFKPEWVTREMFLARKLDCAYTRIIWSFGNNQKGYLFGKDIEADKRSLHNAVVFGEFDDNALQLLGVKSWPTNLSIRGRRLMCKKIITRAGKRVDLQQLERLEQLQQLERLQRLEQLQQLEQLERLQQLERLEQPTKGLSFGSASYESVSILPNSVIYCDPPYANTGGYLKAFDHDKFWQWVRECRHPVYVSEYTAPADIKVIAAFRHKKKNSQTTTDSVEKLFCNEAAFNARKQ